MALITPARPDLEAYRESAVRPFREIASDLAALIGRELTNVAGRAVCPCLDKRPADAGDAELGDAGVCGPARLDDRSAGS